MADYRSFYLRYDGHPNYDSTQILVDDPLKVIVQKMEMCLFTNKGEFIGDSDFGCDLPRYIWESNVSADFIKNIITQQFNTYIPELENFTYTINAEFAQDTLQDILLVDINLDGRINIAAIFQ